MNMVAHPIIDAKILAFCYDPIYELLLLGFPSPLFSYENIFYLLQFQIYFVSHFKFDYLKYKYGEKEELDMEK